MKIGKEQLRLYAGGWQSDNAWQTGVTNNKNRCSIQALFQGRHNSHDKVEQKKLDAREKAMKVVSDAFLAEKSIDDDLADRAGRIDSAKTEIAKAQEQLKGLDEQQARYMEQYGITPDSQEQQDLELLRKRRNSMLPGSDIILTQEEKERLVQIDESGLTDYQKLSLQNDSYRAPFDKEIKEQQNIILEEQVIMREIGLERLKSHTMVDAMRQKDVQMEAANKDIIGMVLQDGRDKIDEDMEEVREEIADKKEENQEQEERIEEIQRRADEAEQVNEERHKKQESDISELVTEHILELDSVKNEVTQQVDNMLHEMKLLQEDLKGSVVDMEV